MIQQLRQKNWRERAGQIVILEIATALLTLFTLVGGVVPIFRIYRLSSPGGFLVSTLGLAAVFFLLSIPVYGLAVIFMSFLIYVYFELEKSKASMAFSGLVSVFLSSALAAVLFYAWTFQAGPLWYESLLIAVEAWMQPLRSLGPNFKFEAAEVAKQLPSALVVLFGIAVWLAVVADRRLMPLRLPSRRLDNFALPEWFLWLVPVSLTLAFLDQSPVVLKVIGTNAINVTVFAYFLQGMAVLAAFFRGYRISVFWRFTLYFLFAANLFFVLSFVGLIDVWINFRDRFLNSKTLSKSAEGSAGTNQGSKSKDNAEDERKDLS